MAKELPYFKFTVADWLTGDIVYEPFNVQGLFINICAIYWQRNGVVSMDDLNKRFKNAPELNELSGRFFSLSDGFISISFLDEQFTDRKSLSNNNSKNGSKGGRPKKPTDKGEKSGRFFLKSEPKAKESNIEKKRKEKNTTLENELNFDFVEQAFNQPFLDWVEYCKLIKKPLLHQMTLEAAYKNMKELCKTPYEAMRAVNFSISSNYKSLCKQDGNQQPKAPQPTKFQGVYE